MAERLVVQKAAVDERPRSVLHADGLERKWKGRGCASRQRQEPIPRLSKVILTVPEAQVKHALVPPFGDNLIGKLDGDIHALNICRGDEHIHFRSQWS